MGRLQLGVTFNAQPIFHFYPGIRSIGRCGLSQGWKSAGWLVQEMATPSHTSRLEVGLSKPVGERPGNGGKGSCAAPPLPEKCSSAL